MPRNAYGLPGIYNASPITLTDGRGAALALDSSGRIIVSPVSGGSNVNIADIAGTAASVNNGTSDTGTLRVTVASDSTGNIATIGTSVTPGIAAANLGKAEDAAHSSGDTGVMSLAVRNDTPTALAGTTLDYIPLTTDVLGKLWISGSGLTGAAVPVSAHYMAISGSAGNLQGVGSVSVQGDGTSLAGGIAVGNFLFNGSNFDRTRSGGVTGMQGVALQASPSGGWSFTNISTSTTTTVKSGAGTFHLASINTLGTVASTCTFYDNTAGSGTIIAIINSLTLSGSFIYDIAFATGLTVVTTGTAAPNITVAYK